jgi:FKBP-type peptidyl-prolyl cis-trans isomerase FkpA
MSVTAVPIRPLKKGSVVKLWIGLGLLALAAAALAWFATAAFQPVTTGSGVGLRTVKPGTGARITPADVVALHYKLHVNKLDSRVIQDSRESGQPFVTTTQGIYPGFAEGLQLMQPGGSYILTLPSGTHEQGPIPAGAPFKSTDALVFEIDVLQVEPGAAQRFLQMQQMQQMQQMERMQQMQNGAGQGGQGEAPPAGSPPAGPPPAG